MLSFDKAETVSKQIQTVDEIDSTLQKVKISKIIKFNLALAYFIILTFLLLKLLLT
jgi:hypothetical protein